MGSNYFFWLIHSSLVTQRFSSNLTNAFIMASRVTLAPTATPIRNAPAIASAADKAFNCHAPQVRAPPGTLA